MKRNRKGKTLGPFKATENEVRQEIQREMKPAIRSMMSYPDMNIALGNSVNQFSQAQRYKLFQGLEKSMKSGVDYDYLKAIIFPELFSSDIPQPYTNLSYCRFSDRSNITVGTGIAGGGTIGWWPRVNSGPCLYYMGGDAPTYPKFPANMKSTIATHLQLGFNQDYSSYFTQCNLVAASITMQYTGQLEQESGFLVGSQIYGIDPTTLSIDDIENGQYVTRCRPSEGIRFVYLPTDAADYDLYPCQPINGAAGYTHNSGAQSTGNEKMISMVITLGAATPTNSVFLDGTNVLGTEAIGGAIPIQLQTASGSLYTQAGDTTVKFNSNTNYVCVYWTGLEPGKMWLRVDMMRRFIGLPKSSYRDIVELVRSKKNFDSKKTFDILRTLCINSPVGGHTLKDLDKHQDELVDGLMNSNEAIQLGHMTGVESLGDLSKALSLTNAEQKGLTENFGSDKRIYPYSI